MKAVSFGGAALTWSCSGLDADPLAELFELFEEAPAALASSGERAAIHFDLRPATAAAEIDPLTEGYLPSFFHGAVQAYRGPDGFLLWDRSSRVHVPLDGSSAEGALCAPGRERYAGSSAVLLQVAVTLALRRARLFHMHAAAVTLSTGAAVIIAGASFAGKTTIALALLAAGAGYLGDDALFLAGAADGDDGIRAIAFPRPFHIGPATLAAFPELAPFAEPARKDREKRSLDPRRAFPRRQRATLALRPGATLAVFPSVSGGPTSELAKVTKAEALGHLLSASAVLVVEGAPGREENLALLRALCLFASCYELRLGDDALASPERVIAARLEGAL